MQITYQKRDGSIITRYRNTALPYKIGDETSMGWKVLNIMYEYKNQYYTQYEYNRIMYNNKQKYIKKREVKEKVVSCVKSLLYFIVIDIILYYIKIRLSV